MLKEILEKVNEEQSFKGREFEVGKNSQKLSTDMLGIMVDLLFEESQNGCVTLGKYSAFKLNGEIIGVDFKKEIMYNL